MRVRGRLQGVVLLLCTSLLAACKQAPGPEQLQTQAAAASAAGDHAQAIIHYKTVLKQDPKNAALRLQLGKEYLAIAEAVLAEHEFRRAQELGAEPAAVKPHLLYALLEQRAFDAVIERSQTEADADTLDAVSLTYRGMALLSKGQVDKAQDAFERALRLNPALPIARLGQARIAFAHGQVNQAFEKVDGVLREQPKLAEALAIKADLHSVLNQREQAIAAYQALLAVQPKNIAAYTRLVTMLSEASRLDEAAAAVQKLVQADPRAHGGGLADYLDALILYHRNDLPAARKRLLSALREMPGFALAQVLAGRIELAQRHNAEAIRHLLSAIRLAPDNIDARVVLARALLLERQPQQAFETLRPVLGLIPDSPQLFELAGIALLQSDEAQLASEYLAYAARLSPDEPRIQRALMLARFASQDTKADVPMLAATDQGAQYARRIFAIVQTLTNPDPEKLRQAEKLAAQLAADYPQEALVPNIQGTIFVKQDKAALARSAFERALAIDPAYSPALMNLAQLDLDQGRRDAALLRFEQLLQQRPGSLTALLGRAEIGVRAGEPPQQVIQWLEKAHQAHPDILKPALLLARHYLQGGDLERAMTAIQKARKIAPGDAGVVEVWGHILTARQDRAGAVTAFAGLVNLRPYSVAPLLHLAQAQFADGRPASAVQVLERALFIDPASVEARAALVMLYAQTGKKSEADRQLAELKKRKTPSLVLAEIEGDAALAGQQPAQAAGIYRQAFEQRPNPQILYKLHTALLAAGQVEDAFKLGREWLAQHPRDLATLRFFATSADRSRHYKIAAELYETVLQFQPGDLVALNNLAMVYAEFDAARALAAAQRALQMAPDNPFVMDTLGWIQTRQNQLESGLRWLEQARRRAPDNPDIAYHHAAALMKTGDTMAAKLHVDQLLRKHQRFAEEKAARALQQQLAH